MAQLTRAQIQDETTKLYSAKQQLAALDQALNIQAEAIMSQARTDVDALKAAQAAQRTALTAAIAASEQRLNEGTDDSTPTADTKGFEGALKAIYANNLLALNTLMAKYPLFLWSLRDENWPYVGAMLNGAVAAKDISADDWTKIQEAAASHNIPLGA